MKHTTMKLLASAAALGLVVAAPAVADGDGDHDPKEAKSKQQSTKLVCEDGDLVVNFIGDDTLWPPNHKYSPLTIEATNESDDEISLTSYITHDEYLEPFAPDEGDEEPEEEQGAGNTNNDASPFFAMESGESPVETTHEVRAERSGRGDGRTYTIDVTANDNDNQCEGSVSVEVPHDMGNGAENKRDHTEG